MRRTEESPGVFMSLHLVSAVLQIANASANQFGLATSPPEINTTNDFSWDENGYVFYCPCHGRFGNQADQFLGALDFSRRLNRTMVLPPWRTYSGENKIAVFDDFFQVEPLKEFHRVIRAHDFVTHLALSKWPRSKRIAFCYTEEKAERKACTVDSDFFLEFWRFVGVEDFSGSINIKGMVYDKTGSSEWIRRFPSSEFPVVALRGPPAPFPVPIRQWPIQRFLKWSKKISELGDNYISLTFADHPFLGVHLRNGADWLKTCSLLEEKRHGLKNLMASTQCLGENPTVAVTPEMCLPSKTTVFNKIRNVISEYNLTRIFIATDYNAYLTEMRFEFSEAQIEILDPEVAQVDLYILGRSTVFIGNCVSSFSSFVRREREVAGKPSRYFGFVESHSTPPGSQNGFVKSHGEFEGINARKSVHEEL